MRLLCWSALAKDEHVFVRDEMEGKSSLSLFADEVALEEAAAGHECVVGDASEECDAAFGEVQSGTKSALVDLGWEVDEFGVFAPGAEGDDDVAAGAEVGGGGGEDAGEAGEESVVADVGEVASVEGVAVAMEPLVHAGVAGGDSAVGGGAVGR